MRPADDLVDAGLISLVRAAVATLPSFHDESRSTVFEAASLQWPAAPLRIGIKGRELPVAVLMTNFPNGLMEHIRHSERNPSTDERTHLLQIWIIPAETGGPPSYEQKSFADDGARNRWVTVASGDGRAGSLTLRQDASMEIAHIDDGASIARTLDPARGYWIQVVAGIVSLNGIEMREGDGAAITSEDKLFIGTETDVEVLLIDLP